MCCFKFMEKTFYRIMVIKQTDLVVRVLLLRGRNEIGKVGFRQFRCESSRNAHPATTLLLSNPVIDQQTRNELSSGETWNLHSAIPISLTHFFSTIDGGDWQIAQLALSCCVRIENTLPMQLGRKNTIEPVYFISIIFL